MCSKYTSYTSGSCKWSTQQSATYTETQTTWIEQEISSCLHAILRTDWQTCDLKLGEEFKAGNTQMVWINNMWTYVPKIHNCSEYSIGEPEGRTGTYSPPLLNYYREYVGWAYTNPFETFYWDLKMLALIYILEGYNKILKTNCD